MKKHLLITLAFFVIGCGKQQPSGSSSETSSSKPGETVYRVYQAIDRRDTTEFKSLMSKSRQDYYKQNPSAIPHLLDQWNRVTAKHDPKVLAEKTDGIVSVVTYKVREPHGDTTYNVQMYLEDGKWKFGSL